MPLPGQQVTVIVAGLPEQPAVVDDVRPPAELRLREPMAGPSDAVLGSKVVLLWTSAAGLHELHAEVTRELLNPMPIWELDVRGKPVTSQRRRFARAAEALPAELTHDGVNSRVVVADLSEGGARCVLQDQSAPAGGEQVELHLMLDHLPLTLAAVVVAVERGIEDRCDVRLSFSTTGRTGDLLRRRVMEQQRRARDQARA